MVGKGGEAAVDALIQAQPDSVDPKVIDALATGRYGVTFTTKGSAPGVNEVKTMKRMLEVFSTIPDDIRGNISIKGVTHVDATGSVGGGYTPATGMIAMKGRRDEAQQKFGAKQTQYDPKTRKHVSQLPKDIDPNCKAQDENKEVEYMGFAAAHEVGHGVDDERGFMAQYGKQEAKGGWIDHGADIEPVADAVGADIARKFPASTFNKSAESRKYIRDKIMNRPTVRPTQRGTPTTSRPTTRSTAGTRWRPQRTCSGASPTATPSPSASGSTTRPTRASGSAISPRRARRASPATSSAPRASGSPSSMPAGRPRSSAPSIRPLDWLTKL